MCLRLRARYSVGLGKRRPLQSAVAAPAIGLRRTDVTPQTVGTIFCRARYAATLAREEHRSEQ
jgi:hypothetical protein